MKKSNKVVLTAIFLSAIASASANAQTVGDTVGSPKNITDTAVSFSDSTAYASDSSRLYNTPQDAYYYPERVGFFGRVRIFFRFGYYGRHWHRYHRHEQAAPRTGTVQHGTSYGPRTGLKTAPAQHTATTSALRHQGFGSTMHNSSATSARS